MPLSLPANVDVHTAPLVAQDQVNEAVAVLVANQDALTPSEVVAAQADISTMQAQANTLATAAATKAAEINAAGVREAARTPVPYNPPAFTVPVSDVLAPDSRMRSAQ
jgi:hypothetical protein